jgi:hypothetical protein
MRTRVKAVFYLPVGEGDRIDYLTDSIEAIYHHCSDDIVVMVMDDSGRKKHGETLREIFPELVVHPTEPRYQAKGLAGRHGYETIRIIKHAVDNYWFDIIMRIDTDALITGDRIEDDLIQLFNEKPTCGLLGRHTINVEGYHIDRGESKILFDRLNKLPYRLYFAWPMTVFNRIIRRAQGNGYVYGELVLGCATAYNFECAFRLAAFIDDFKWVRPIRGLAEDYFTTVFVKYVNMDLGDASHPEGPMAVQLKGIPLTLEKIIEQDKKVIHSIKNDERYSQDEIRAFFKNFRQQQLKERSVHVSSESTSERTEAGTSEASLK